MFLRLLVPLSLLFVVLPIVAEGTPLRRYRATPARELLALVACVAFYFLLWFALAAVVRAITGSLAFFIVIPTLLALISLPACLWLGFKIFGVKPSTPAEPAHAEAMGH